VVVIGIGSAGEAIARKFEKWPQYKVILPKIPVFDSVEEYEEGCPCFSELFEDIEGEVWFVVCGAGKIAGATLRVLEQLKQHKLKALCVCPDPDLLSVVEAKRQKVVFGVLQQYARSGLLDSVYLISNPELERVVGHGTVANYYNNINDAVASVVHYYNIYRNTKPVFGSFHSPKPISRIRTFGVLDLKKNQEKLFFPLDNCTETGYIYNITEEDLQNNQEILKNIKTRVKQKVSADVVSSFAIFSTEFEENFCHVVGYTHFVQ